MKRFIFCLLFLLVLISCTDYELITDSLDESYKINEQLEERTTQLNNLVVEINDQLRTDKINDALKNVDKYRVLVVEYDKLMKEYEITAQNYKNLVDNLVDPIISENIVFLDNNIKTLKTNKKNFNTNIEEWEVYIEEIETVEDNGDFKVIYESVTDPVFLELEKSFKDSQIFETISEGLNNVFSLPQDIEIVLKECEEVNAFYNSETTQIYLCYELFPYFVDLFQETVNSNEELDETITSVTYFVLFHEIGHALVDVLDIPITGKEEDAVDQLSALIFLEGEYSDVVLEGANWFYLKSQEDFLSFWDEHSLDIQRYYNLLCWTYGSNPQEFKYLITTEWDLPKERAEKCPYEYYQLSNSWNSLLSVYMKN